MECVPCVRAEVVKDAEPLDSAPVPKGVAPSRNWTLPVAEAGLTVARMVTGPPTGDGFCVEVTVTDDSTSTVWESAAEVDEVSFASPEYAAVTEGAPAASEELENMATPEAMGAVPITEVPSRNWTLPVA